MLDAITNLITALQALSWLTVTTDGKAPGSAPYTLNVTLGEYAEEHHFGATKATQALALTLHVKGTTTSAGAISAKCAAINDTIEADRRRGGNAQTTIAGAWTPEDNEGREGVAMTSTVEVQTI